MRLAMHRTPFIFCLLFALIASTTACHRTDGQQILDDPLERGTFYLSVVETIEDEPTPRNITDQLVALELVLHGFERTEDRAKARYILEGTTTGRFFKDVVFEYAGQKQLLEKQYKGEFECVVTDTSRPADDPKRVEKIAIPTVKNGRTDDRLARRDLCRLLATDGARALISGSLLGNGRVTKLIFELEDAKSTRTFNEVVADLAAIGQPAIPYLIDTLSNEESVVLKGRYPGFVDAEENPLLCYHIADMALGDIFQAFSGLDIASDEDELLRVKTAWIWAWEDRQGIPERYRTRADLRKKTVKAKRPEEETPKKEDAPAKEAPKPAEGDGTKKDKPASDGGRDLEEK